MQKMGGGVVAHGGAAQRADPRLPISLSPVSNGPQNMNLVDDRGRSRLVGAFDDRDALAGFGIEQQTGIADLSARFGIERSSAERQLRLRLSPPVRRQFLSTIRRATSTGASNVSRPMNSAGGSSL